MWATSVLANLNRRRYDKGHKGKHIDIGTHTRKSNVIYGFLKKRGKCVATDLLGWPLFQLHKWMIFQQFTRYVRQIHVIVSIVGTSTNHQLIAGRRIPKIRHAMILWIHFFVFISNSTYPIHRYTQRYANAFFDSSSSSSICFCFGHYGHTRPD